MPTTASNFSTELANFSTPSKKSLTRINLSRDTVIRERTVLILNRENANTTILNLSDFE